MPAYLIVALMLIGAPQHEPLERAAAEPLARSGEPAAAMAMFARIVEQTPDDVQARRPRPLAGRLGHHRGSRRHGTSLRPLPHPGRLWPARSVGVTHSFDATYAYGIESFEQLTAPRPGSLRMTTAAGGIRISLPSITTVGATWEHQWRSNDTAVDRVTLSLSRFWP